MSSAEERGLAIPDDMALEKVQRSDVVALLLETAGTLKLTDDQRKIVFAKVDPDLVEIREDGIVYLPAVEYKQTLCEAFGLEWAIVPESPKPVEVDGVILWGFHLFIQGQPIAFAWGEQQYKKGDWYMSYGDAMEGAKSNAIMRLCKQIGIAQDLWRPSFIRKWKVENAETYEGWDKKRQEKKLLWKRLENTGNVEEQEADEQSEEEQATGDTDRFRRTAFLMTEYLVIDESRMKAEVKEMFGVDSRALLAPAQWKEYRDYLEGTMGPNQVIDWGRWLDVRSAIKSLAERGMDKKELKFYLQVHFQRLDILDREIPDDLAQRLSRSGAADKKYAILQKAVQGAKEWGAAIGGQGKAEELIGALQSVLDDVTNTSSLAEFFKNLNVTPETDGHYRLTDITPAMFEGWKAALGVQDNQPKPDPDPPAEAKTEEATGGDTTLDNMPDVPPKQMFLAEAEKRFGKIDDVEAWCWEKIPKHIHAPWADWTDEHFEALMPALLDLPLLAAQEATEEPAATEPQGEPEEEQEQGDATLSSTTKELIKQALLDFGDRRYQTVKSLAFKRAAAEAIERDVDMIGISELTEGEGLVVLESLKVERQEQLAKIEEAEAAKFKEALETGEVVDDDPLNQGELLEDGMLAPEDEKAEAEAQAEFTKEQEAEEDKASWEQQNEIYTSLAELMPDAVNKKGDSVASHRPEAKQWISDAIDRPSPGIAELTYEEADRVIDYLNNLGAAPNAATPEEPADGITDEQRDRIKEIAVELLPTTLNPHLSPNVRHWITEAIGYRSPGIAALSKAEGDKVIESLEKIKEQRQAQGKDKPNVS